MKRATLFPVLCAIQALIMQFMLLTIGAAAAPAAANNIRIRQILDRPYDLGLETVKLEGKVMKHIIGKTFSSKAYLFRDDYGDEIKIVTDRELPMVDYRYAIVGMVVVNDSDKETPEITIIEKGRNGPLNVTAAAYDPPSGESGKTGPGISYIGKNRMVTILFVIGGIIIIAIAILAGLIISKKTGLTNAFSTPTANDTDSALSGYPEPSSYIEDSSVKFAAPPEGTLKLLPGRLEMTEGFDVHKNIRFFKLPSQEETEFTFGREAGTPYIHIQLKSPTVSAKQAKLLWTNGRYMLINYSTTNPTVVDGKSLGKDESVSIKEESKIEMGEIAFIFHEK
jgi:hypothetical protein